MQRSERYFLTGIFGWWQGIIRKARKLAIIPDYLVNLACHRRIGDMAVEPVCANANRDACGCFITVHPQNLSINGGGYVPRGQLRYSAAGAMQNNMQIYKSREAYQASWQIKRA